MIPIACWLFLATPTFAQDLPEGLEEGSAAKNVTVREGETVDSIAAEWAVLPSELRAWNKLGDGEKVKPGEKLVIWVAPSVAPGTTPKERSESPTGVRPFVGLQFGPTIPLSPLGVAPAPRLELGIELPVWERRIRIFAAGSFARPLAAGDANDDRLPGDGAWTYALRQQEWTVAIGPTLRLPGIVDPFVPEFSLAPELYILQSRVDGAGAGKTAFGESKEQYSRVGIYFAAGGAFELGLGELTVNLSIATSGLNGVVTGESSTARLTPMIGYRLVF